MYQLIIYCVKNFILVRLDLNTKYLPNTVNLSYFFNGVISLGQSLINSEIVAIIYQGQIN